VKIRPQWEGRTHGGSLGQKGLFFLFSRFRLSFLNIFLYPILGIVVLFYLLFSHTSFKSIWFYFRKIHNYGVMKSFRKTYMNHFHFGQELFVKFALFGGKKNKFKVQISGEEAFGQLVESPRGAIIVSSHVGNIEILGYLLGHTKKRINVIVFNEESIEIRKYRRKVLEENNIYQIPVLDDMSHIFLINNALQNGEMIIIPSDRIFTGNKSAKVNFMGLPADFPTGTYHIALKFDVPVITIFVMRESSGNYHLYFNRIDNFPDNNLSKKEKVELFTKNYVSDLEKIINRYPEQWYNFYKFWD
jgi:predicted LPLAT superfamily acyltransferase